MESMWQSTYAPPVDKKLTQALDRAGQAWAHATKVKPGVQIELWALLNWLVDERKLWRDKYRAIELSIQAEQQDPAGTIWEHAAKLQEQILELNKKLQAQYHEQNPTSH